VRVHSAGEHALEFQLFDVRSQTVDVIGDSGGSALVLLGFGQFEQLARAGKAVAERADAIDDPVERRALLAELLGALGVVPDVRVFQLASYFLEPLALGVVVKDTP
jgi:hypothetical protein